MAGQGLTLKAPITTAADDKGPLTVVMGITVYRCL